MKQKNLSKQKVIIIIHEATHGPGHDLRDYFLRKRKCKLLYIAHPLLFNKTGSKNSSHFQLYENGKLIKEGQAYHWKFPEPILYIKDFFYSIFWVFKYIGISDTVIGINNLNAFTAYLLKLIGFAKTTVYYVIDYVPQRFSNKVLNTIYHAIEKIAAEKSDWTWNLSPRMITGREEKWHKKFKNQLVVPHGVHFNRIKRVPFEKINKHEILFMGSLMEKQGIQLVIKAMPMIIKNIPNIEFTIIGEGPYEEELKKIVEKLKLGKHVHFLGYIKSHAEMENRMAKASVAVALYSRELDVNDFTYYGDPGKVKNYLGAGVPVIITDVPCIAQEIVINKCGFIAGYTEESLMETLLHFFSNEKIMIEYRKNALTFSKQYDWDRIFSGALKKAGL